MKRRSVPAVVGAAVLTMSITPAATAALVHDPAAPKARVVVTVTSARDMAGSATEVVVTNLGRRKSADLLLAGRRITILHASTSGRAQARVVVPRTTGRFTLAVRMSGHVMATTTLTVVAAPARVTTYPPAVGSAYPAAIPPAPSSQEAPTSSAPASPSSPAPASSSAPGSEPPVSGPTSAPPALTGTGSWLAVGHDPARTENSDPGSPINASNAASVVPAWTAYASGQEADPAVYDGMAIIGTYLTDPTYGANNGGVEAVDQETGEVVWDSQFAFGADVNTTPVIDPQRGLVYVAYDDVRGPNQGAQVGGVSIVAYKLADGQQVWRHDDTTNHVGVPSNAPSQIESVLETSAGLVYSDNESFQQSLDLDSGAVEWQRTSFEGEGAAGTGSIEATAFGDGDLIEGTPQGIEVDDPATGQARWTLTGVAADLDPLIADGRIYFASGGATPTGAAGLIEAYSATGCGAFTCPPLWKTVLPTPIDQGFAYGDGELYAVGNIEPSVIDPDGDPPDSLYALRADTGAVSWTATAPVDYTPTGRDVTVSGNLVLVTGSSIGTVAAYDADGCAQATCAAVGSLTLPDTAGMESAEVIGDRLFVGGLRVYVYRLP